MSINSHLTDTASKLIITQSERNVIDGNINSLYNKLALYFQSGKISEKFIFGSFARKTLMPRRADINSDVDIMIVFSEQIYSTSTYIRWLKEFAQAKYATSEIFQSHPTIVLNLSNIKIELVPALKSAYDSYKIPAPNNNFESWMETHPYSFNNTLSSKNTLEKSLIRPLVRLMKYWNALNNYVFSSYELEGLIANRYYFFCTSLQDYLFDFVESISTYNMPSYKIEKIEKFKKIISEARKLEKDGYPNLAEAEIKKSIPFY